jgi:hypothetical protein
VVHRGLGSSLNHTPLMLSEAKMHVCHDFPVHGLVVAVPIQCHEADAMPRKELNQVVAVIDGSRKPIQVLADNQIYKTSFNTLTQSLKLRPVLIFSTASFIDEIVNILDLESVRPDELIDLSFLRGEAFTLFRLFGS